MQNLSAYYRIYNGLFFLLLGLFVTFLAASLEVNCFLPDAWFNSQYRLLKTFTSETDNFAPIGVPAIAYSIIHFLQCLIWTCSLEAEFYLGMFFHHLLLLSSAIAFLLIGRLFGATLVLSLMGALFLIFIESTFLPQIFSSENCLIALHIWSIYFILDIYVKCTEKTAFRVEAPYLAGALLAGAVCIKPTSIVIIPCAGVLFFLSGIRGKQLAGLFARFFLSVLLIVSLQMGSNLIRYGRFEISNSIGLHLWNSIHAQADLILRDIPSYQLLRDTLGEDEVKKMVFWRLGDAMRRSSSAELTANAKSLNNLENFLKPMVLSGIRAHPFIFLKIVSKRFIESFGTFPSDVGFQNKSSIAKIRLAKNRVNPLNRDSYLPPLLSGMGPSLMNALTAVNIFSRSLLSFVYIVLIFGFAYLSTRAFIYRDTRLVSHSLIPSFFLLGCFIASRFLICSLETYIERYSLILLSTVFIVVGLTLHGLYHTHHAFLRIPLRMFRVSTARENPIAK